MLAALCLTAGALQVNLPVTRFTLRWQHSIEKIEWEEDYDVLGAWLHLSEARIRGSGAGMEPPDGALLRDGVWHYRLDDPWRHEVVLARSGFVPDYELCIAGRCERLMHWVPIAAGPTTLRACERGSVESPGEAHELTPQDLRRIGTTRSPKQGARRAGRTIPPHQSGDRN